MVFKAPVAKAPVKSPLAKPAAKAPAPASKPAAPAMRAPAFDWGYVRLASLGGGVLTSQLVPDKFPMQVGVLIAGAGVAVLEGMRMYDAAHDIDSSWPVGLALLSQIAQAAFLFFAGSLAPRFR